MTNNYQKFQITTNRTNCSLNIPSFYDKIGFDNKNKILGWQNMK